MNPVINLVQDTSRGLAPPKVQMPGTAWTVFSLFHKVHLCWRWYNKAEVYTNTNNFCSLLTGHTINFLFGDSTAVKVAAQCVLISSRILKCVEQQVEVYRSFQELTGAVNSKFPNERAHWSRTLPHVAPQNYSLLNHIERVAKASLRVVASLFKLSLYMMDAVEAFSFDSRTRNDSINELFVNSNYCLDKVVDSKETLATALKKNQQLIDKVLVGIHSPYTADHMIVAVTQTINTIEKVQKVANIGGRSGREIFKRAFSNVMMSLGIQKHTPTFLVPGKAPQAVG